MQFTACSLSSNTAYHRRVLQHTLLSVTSPLRSQAFTEENLVLLRGCSCPPPTIQHFLWCLWQPLLQAVPLDTLEDRIQNAVGQVDPPRRNTKSPMPHNVTLSKPHNKEKSYKKYLKTQCSEQWRKHLEIVLSNPPGRVRAYVHWHLHNKHKRSLYKPAPYLTHQSSPYQLELRRIRTQHTIHIIPSHLHYAFWNPQADYQDRVCPYCLAQVHRSLVMSSTSYVSALQQK